MRIDEFSHPGTRVRTKLPERSKCKRISKYLLHSQVRFLIGCLVFEKRDDQFRVEIAEDLAHRHTPSLIALASEILDQLQDARSIERRAPM